MATAVSADDARVKLEALERGVDGVLLRTDDPLQVGLTSSDAPWACCWLACCTVCVLLWRMPQSHRKTRLEGRCRRLQAKELAGYVQRLARQDAQRLCYDVATVTRLQPAGMGDR